MAIQKVTYTDKEDLNIDPTVPLINKVIAADMNEIKSVINNNADELENVEAAPEVMIQTTTPTEGKIWINPEETPSGTGFELDKFYPVGSIYINTTGVNPSTFMGGTWQSFGAGRVLVGQDTTDTDFDTLGETGGSKYLQSHFHTAGTYDGYTINNNSVGGSGGPNAITLDTSSTTSSTRIKTNTAGSGNSGNLQPYQVFAIWKRVS